MKTIEPRHKSELVIVNSAMSFSGAAQRSMRIRGDAHGFELVMRTIVAIIVLALWEVAVVVWYVVAVGIFGIITIPYRILRRGARKRKIEAHRHREMMGAIEKRNQRVR